MQKCRHRGLPKIKMYHLQITLRLMIDHQSDRWYKPKKEQESKLIPEGHLCLHLSMEKPVYLKYFSASCFLKSQTRYSLKYMWLVLQHVCPKKFMNFGLKAKLRLLNMHTGPRYWVILTDISDHIKNLSTLLKEVVSNKKK